MYLRETEQLVTEPLLSRTVVLGQNYSENGSSLLKHLPLGF